MPNRILIPNEMKFTFLLLLSALVFTGKISAQNPAKKATIAFYNVENLFDTLNDPSIDDEEFLPQGKNKWTGLRYEKKLSQLARVIDSLGDADGPEILGMCEVENKKVLEDLVNLTKLKTKNYGIVHHNSPDGRGIDVAMIYKKGAFSVTNFRGLSVKLEDDPNFKTRDVLMVTGNLKGKKISLFVNHWPSRRGGEEKSEIKRFAAARVARKAIDSLVKADKNAKILLMGDFNDEPENKSIAEILKAIHPKTNKKADLYDLMWPLKENGEGSHFYENKAHVLDHIMVSSGFIFGKKPRIVSDPGIYKPEFMQESNPKYKGNPFRTFVGAKYLGGFSDHFPVFVQVEL